MVFHWSLSDRSSPQVSRSLLIILAVLNNAVVWIISLRPLTSKSSSPFNSHLVTVLKNCHFHVPYFFNSLARSRCLFLSTFFQFYSVVTRDSKFHNSASSLFLLIIMTRTRWSACMFKFHRIFCVSFSWIYIGLCSPFVRMVKFQFLSQLPMDYIAHPVVYYYYYYYTLRFSPISVVDGLSLKFDSHPVSRTLLSILAVLNNAVVCIAYTRPLISKSSCPFTKHLITVPKAPIATDTTVNFIIIIIIIIIRSCITYARFWNILLNETFGVGWYSDKSFLKPLHSSRRSEYEKRQRC